MTKYTAIFSIILVAVFSIATKAVYAGGVLDNDNFSGAQALTIENGSAQAISTNLNATKETGEPNHARNAGGTSVWFKLTPTTTTVLRISAIDNSFNTLLAVYTGTSVDQLTTISYNDDCTSGCSSSTVDLMVTGGTTYYIAVDGFNAGAPASGIFRLTVLDTVAPMQDDLLGRYNLGSDRQGSIGGTNYNATRQVGEPNHINPSNPGEKSVWYTWKPNATFGVLFELKEISSFSSQITVFKSNLATPTFADLSRVVSNIDSLGDTSSTKYRVKFLAEAGVNYFIAVAGDTPSTADSGNFQLTFRQAPLKYSLDMDGNNDRASIGVFRPSDGIWYTRAWLAMNGLNIFAWGKAGDVPIGSDFDADGWSDRAAVRNENGKKVWYISYANSTTATVQWGLSTDTPIVGDFDGDSRADVTVIRNTAQGLVWYVRRSLDGSLRTFTFGTTGDRPILGDFNGDGWTEVAVVRNTAAGMVWYFLNSSNYNEWSAVQFGQAPDVPAVEDFDGDGKTDIAVFRPSNGTWYIQESGTGQVKIANFGLSGDTPQPTDYDADGKANLAVFRPSDGTWYIAKPTGDPAQNFTAIPWGLSTDIPVTSNSGLSQ